MKKLFVDGYTIGGNPSRKGGGYVITDHIGKVVEEKEIIKYHYTNNEAEVTGLVRALELVDEGGSVYVDSYIAMRWILRGGAKARPDLNVPFVLKGKKLMREKSVSINLVPRDENIAGIYIESMQLEKQQHP